MALGLIEPDKMAGMTLKAIIPAVLCGALLTFVVGCASTGLEPLDLNVVDINVADATLFETWKLKSGDEVLLEMPCVAALRGFVLSHVVHHRGQLSVYLRLLEEALPQVYGPTADHQGF